MAKHTNLSLALRDPAMAALMGATPDDFGMESDFGVEFGDDYGFGGDADYGYDFGADGPAAVAAAPAAAAAILAKGPSHPAHPLHPMNQGKMWAIWQQHHREQERTSHREMQLEPNKGSRVKVERYAFAVSQALVLGTVAALTLTGSPDTNFRPQRANMNAPQAGFATISEIKVANVSVTSGVTDAFMYNPLAVGQHLDMPTLTPANKATVLGGYTGSVPPGFVGGSAFLFVAEFKGPASIVA
jgi:hypothetical protein